MLLMLYGVYALFSILYPCAVNCPSLLFKFFFSLFVFTLLSFNDYEETVLIVQS